LLDRRRAEDLLEVESVLELWRTRTPGRPPMDLWTLRIRALLASARGDEDGCRQLMGEYAMDCETTGYRHHWGGPHPALTRREC
jgi:adenylate cyclase